MVPHRRRPSRFSSVHSSPCLQLPGPASSGRTRIITSQRKTQRITQQGASQLSPRALEPHTPVHTTTGASEACRGRRAHRDRWVHTAQAHARAHITGRRLRQPAPTNTTNTARRPAGNAWHSSSPHVASQGARIAAVHTAHAAAASAMESLQPPQPVHTEGRVSQATSNAPSNAPSNALARMALDASALAHR